MQLILDTCEMTKGRSLLDTFTMEAVLLTFEAVADPRNSISLSERPAISFPLTTPTVAGTTPCEAD
jgi:hypothetical protein